MLALALAGAVTAQPGASRQCMLFPLPSEAFDLSDVVFVGTVVANKPTGVMGAHVITHITTFRAERIWKGPTRREFDVGDDRPFEAGKRYVVFASGSSLSTAGACGWAQLADEAVEKTRWLERQPSRRDAKDWQNPYLVIYPDGIELRAMGQPVGERRLDVSRLQQALNALPLAAWPYGRVVAMQDVGILGADSDAEQIAKLRQAALTVLERLGVTVDDWPV